MSETAIAPPSSSLLKSIPVSPAMLALLATIVPFCAGAAGGFQMLGNMGADNDSQMRLVQIRDLMAGQSWFDVYQYRLGMPEGSSMHWSRLVDAPIAFIIWLATALTGSQSLGEGAGLIFWPALTFFTTVYLIVRAARRYAGEEAMVPAAVIGAVTIYFIGIFSPGVIDHHNIELALTLAILTFLLESIDRPAMAYLSGIAATLALAIGMETAGYVAFAGIAVGGWYLIQGEQAKRQTINFGIGFALTAVAAMVITKRPSQWLLAECDAYSVAQFSVALAAGLGIAIVAGSNKLSANAIQRSVALGALGVVLAAILLTAFPQCLAEPYANVEPRLRDYWMRSITEAQPIWSVINIMPLTAATYYPPIFVALIWLVWRTIRHGLRIEDAFVAAFLVPAALVSIYQLRGANFALGFAVIPLAAMVANQRKIVETTPTLSANFRAVGAWLISINMVWMLATNFVLDSAKLGQAEMSQNAIGSDESCIRADDYSAIAAMPSARVVSITNLGSSILRYTQHHSYAGPYHRNVAGNLVALDLLAAKPDAAQKIALDNGINLIAVCRGNPESKNYADGTLQTELNAHRAPGWLNIVPETKGQNLEVYRVMTN